ncbi:MAG: hypothetical protein AAF694_30345 [Bacteroidota bacterium]
MKKLFIIGILLQTIGQLFFSIPSSQINLLEPIDFIHWTLLIGFVLVIPYVLQFSIGWFQKIGATFSLMGLICLICMCAIDFVLWSFRELPEERNELIAHIMNEPMIWPVFFTIGPAFYYTGMSIQSLAYLKSKLIPALLVIIGATLVGLGGLIFTENRVIFMIGKILFGGGLIYLCVLLSPDLEK